MRRTSSKLTIWFAAAALAAGTPTLMLARVKVNINFDKKFDFKPVRTWAWNPGEPGQIMMGRTAEDDPKAAQKLAEPIILQEVASELTKRGLTAATGQPDVTVTYYLLLTTSINAQTVGQFLPATLDWGLPPFPQATQALKVMNAGSLVLDFNSKDDIVWRGVAQAELKMDAEPKKREAVLREAIRDLLRRFPPK
jgi:Domain of unknown function (DUF4136)